MTKPQNQLLKESVNYDFELQEGVWGLDCVIKTPDGQLNQESFDSIKKIELTNQGILLQIHEAPWDYYIEEGGELQSFKIYKINI